ncbi:MAG TPA: DNA-3-methyladenine glycosylase I [Candidatus Lumbricidophila sp.]|nr:DNA-3-methyladenine glycosylase I [Candidatus Lumbricidophila sp.]
MTHLATGDDGVTRCGWCAGDEAYRAYHDTEWGVPVRDPVRLFEKVCLEGFQAGLSWITILRRREAFRAAFHGFDPTVIASFGASDIARLVDDASIIRHRGKIEATISNARAMLALPRPLNELIWSHATAARPDRPARWEDVPATTPESVALSTELRNLGFRFVGPTTMYALMQSCGLVDDHFEGCFRAGNVR